MSDAPVEEVKRFVWCFAHRRQRYAAANTLVIGAALAGSWLLLWAAMDRWIGFSVYTRISVLIAANFLILGYIVGAGLRIWGPRSANISHAAGLIESRSPECAERLITVITQDQMPHMVQGSSSLRDAVAIEILQIFRKSPPEHLITVSAFRNGGLFLSAMLLIGFVMAAVFGNRLPALLKRELTPWASICRVTTTQIEVHNVTNTITSGESLSVVADITPDRGEAMLWIGPMPDQLQAVPMARVFGGRYAVTIPRLQHSVVYIVRSGDAESRQYPVNIVAPPLVKQIDLRLETPEGSTTTLPKSDGTFVVRSGTHVFVTLTANQSLDDATLTVAGMSVITDRTSLPNVRSAQFWVTQSGPWSINLTSSGGIKGTGPHDMRIITLSENASRNVSATAIIAPGYEPPITNYFRAISATQP